MGNRAQSMREYWAFIHELEAHAVQWPAELAGEARKKAKYRRLKRIRRGVKIQVTNINKREERKITWREYARRQRISWTRREKALEEGELYRGILPPS